MDAQEGYGICLVCVFVCLSVTTLAATSVVSTLKMRSVGVYLRLFSVFNSWIFYKIILPFRSYDVKKPMCKINNDVVIATGFSPF